MISFDPLKNIKNHIQLGTTITYRNLSEEQFARKSNVLDVTVWQTDVAFPKLQSVLHAKVLWQSLENLKNL
jgi:hypothetical protein